jgi:hypothetical protein
MDEPQDGDLAPPAARLYVRGRCAGHRTLSTTSLSAAMALVNY